MNDNFEIFFDKINFKINNDFFGYTYIFINRYIINIRMKSRLVLDIFIGIFN